MIHVNGAEVAEMCEIVERHLDGMEDTISRFHGRVETLQSQWSGQAQEAFNEAAVQLQAALVVMSHLARGLTAEAESHVSVIGMNDRRRVSVWRR